MLAGKRWCRYCPCKPGPVCGVKVSQLSPPCVRNFSSASGVGERIWANDSLATVYCSVLAEVLHAFLSRHVQYSLLIQWDPIPRWNQALAIIPTLFQNLVLLQASACDELSCWCATKWGQWWSVTSMIFEDVSFLFISYSFLIAHLTIWYHSSMYLSSSLASRPELTEEDALALPASVAQARFVCPMLRCS